ncbi:uncharacterized protein LOC114444813 [Parambassis ranga]|uniref:Uncharacterized protein LOC114444813 n=1 Tax=Parambassis ranga TaxID=210632 RepID=A0A6P7JF05_9TELE|nr:uncharacterized protein LOC114444813 [Parambassis ranga]
MSAQVKKRITCQTVRSSSVTFKGEANQEQDGPPHEQGPAQGFFLLQVSNGAEIPEALPRTLTHQSWDLSWGPGYSHPQKDDFSAVKTQKGWELELKTIKEDHSATYYCGPGTKLIVTEQQVVTPMVSVYPAAPTGRPEGSSSLLCLASDMFPPLVRFSWKRQKKNGLLEELHPAEGEQLELRETGHSVTILFVKQQESSSYKYSCYVKHEGGTVKAQTDQGIFSVSAVSLLQEEPADLPAVQLTDWSFQSQCRVKLLLLLYTVLIVKSLLYCCGLSLLMIG